MTFVFADFAKARRPRGGPIEVPIDERDALAREWADRLRLERPFGLPRRLGASRPGS